MRDENSIRLKGRLGRDPEFRSTPSGKSVVRLRLATSHYRRAAEEGGPPVEVTTWHNVSAWGRDAEILAQEATKGTRLVIDGTLRYEDYTDKDSVKRTTTVIVVKQFDVCASRKGNAVPDASLIHDEVPEGMGESDNAVY